MNIFNGIRDERIREYVPVTRIIREQQTSGTEKWICSRTIQPGIEAHPNTAKIRADGSVVLDFGIELHGGVRILNQGKGGTIRLRFGESVGEAMGNPDQCHTIHDEILHLPAMGMLEYGTTAFRFVRIDNHSGEELSIANVLAVAVYRDLNEVGSFESSDERLNRIWKTARHTILLNMQDYIYDGPKRDRLVWMGDLHPEIRGIFAAYGETTLVRKSLDFLVEHTPLPCMMNNITTYTCWWVIAMMEYYQYTGDRLFLEKHKEYLCGVLDLFRHFIGEDGGEIMPERRFLDWPNDANSAAKHAGLQGLLYWMFQSGETLLNVLGCGTDKIREARFLLKKHIPDCAGSKAAAGLQTVSGLADRKEILLNNPLNGVSTFYGFYMLLGQPTTSALNLIRRYWGAMLDRGATSFWEDFNLDWLENSGRIDEITPPGMKDLHADFGAYCYKGLRHSLCHGWACGPMPFLSERILGVSILEPGAAKVRIHPDLGDLEYVSGIYPTILGGIQITADRSGKTEVNAPAGMECIVE